MYKLIIRFSDGSIMPIYWGEGTTVQEVKHSVAKLLAFRLAVRAHAVKKSTALPLRKFTVDFLMQGEEIFAGVENVQYSPKKEILNDSLNDLIDIAFQAMELKELQATVSAPELSLVQAN